VLSQELRRLGLDAQISMAPPPKEPRVRKSYERSTPRFVEPERKSRRKLGLNPEVSDQMLPEDLTEIRIKESQTEAAREALAQASLDELLKRWQSDATKDQPASERQIFLIPSGEGLSNRCCAFLASSRLCAAGGNDHTLKLNTNVLKSYCWGFAEGLYTRIFNHIRPR
jgi:hypothetical protein